jgi:cellulase
MRFWACTSQARTWARSSTPVGTRPPQTCSGLSMPAIDCVQIQVTDGGSVQLPTGIPLPGSYNPNDTSGILLQLWQIQANPSQLFYIAPGGPGECSVLLHPTLHLTLWTVLLPGGTGDWGRATYGGDPQPPLSGSSSASKPTSTATSTVITTAKSTTTVSSVTTTRSSSSSSAPAPTGSGVAQYGQCGGTNYQGSTTCASPFKCVGVSAPCVFLCPSTNTS